MFSVLSRSNFAIWIAFNLSSANALNSYWSKILSLGKELKYKVYRLEKGGVNPNRSTYGGTVWYINTYVLPIERSDLMSNQLLMKRPEADQAMCKCY